MQMINNAVNYYNSLSATTSFSCSSCDNSVNIQGGVTSVSNVKITQVNNCSSNNKNSSKSNNNNTTNNNDNASDNSDNASDNSDSETSSQRLSSDIINLIIILGLIVVVICIYLIYK